MTQHAKPTITTAKEATALVQSLRHRAKEKNQDLRTLALNKALHLLAESMGYENWQQLHAALIRKECLDSLKSDYGFDTANAEAAWGTLDSTRIREAETGSELADYLASNYAQVPVKVSGNPQNLSKEDKLNQSALNDLMDAYRLYSDGEDVDDLGVYSSQVTGTEICLTLGSATSLYLMINSEERVISGRIESSGFGEKSTLTLEKDQLSALEDLFHVEISMALSGK